MGIFGGGGQSAYPPMSPPALPPAPAPVPSMADDSVKKARDEQKKRAAALAGYASTIATSGRGVMAPANTTATAGGKQTLGA